MNIKNIMLPVLSVSLFIMASCSNPNEKSTATAEAKDTVVKKDFSNVVFATKRDTSCGMPLTAGLEDTLQFDGKVYGFCSKECKNAFIAQLKKEKKI